MALTAFLFYAVYNVVYGLTMSGSDKHRWLMVGLIDE